MGPLALNGFQQSFGTHSWSEIALTKRSRTILNASRKDPMAVALEWVSRITAVALEMVLPGLFGQWLDAKLGTNFLVLAGFVLGLVGGVWHLIAMTQPKRPDSSE